MKESLRYITWPAIAGLLAALLILSRWGLPAQQEKGLEQEPISYAQAVRAAAPSVVNIYTAKLVSSPSSRLGDWFNSDRRVSSAQRQRVERSLGSGVIMTADGHILTNNHVIDGADAIQVLLHDGRTANAVVVGTDTATDLAVLQVKLPDLQPVKIGDSNAARVGDVVLAIGNPLGFGHSVTQGIVSALGRYGLQLSTYEDYIQTDATIHQGNSGGALINTSGRLLGINTLIYTPDGQSGNTGIGISLAIPVNLASFVMQDLIDYGEVIRGWLGVSVELIRSVNTNGRPGQALVVAGVADGGPAQKAGIQANDIITHINEEPVTDGRLTMHKIALLRPGDIISITVARGQQTLNLKAVVGVMRQSQAS